MRNEMGSLAVVRRAPAHRRRLTRRHLRLAAVASVAILSLGATLTACAGDGTAEADAPGPSAGGSPSVPEDRDDPRHSPEPSPGGPAPVVADDWQVVTGPTRGVAFDVPPHWRVGAEGGGYAWFDQSQPEGYQDVVHALNHVAGFEADACPGGGRLTGVAGTRWVRGVPDTSEAAFIVADNLVLHGYDQTLSGTLDLPASEPFANDHGVAGHIAHATVTDAPLTAGHLCGTGDAMAIGVAFLNADSDMVGWGFVAETGYGEEPTRETIEQIVGSIRFHTP